MDRNHSSPLNKIDQVPLVGLRADLQNLIRQFNSDPDLMFPKIVKIEKNIIEITPERMFIKGDLVVTSRSGNIEPVMVNRSLGNNRYQLDRVTEDFKEGVGVYRTGHRYDR